MGQKMNCTLCGKPIKDYDQRFNHLQIDDSHSADICQGCIDKFTHWQGNRIAQLFPTSAMKKRFGKSS